MIIKNVIKSLNFFSNLDDKQIDILENISSVNTYDEEYVLYYENSQVKYLYFLISGEAKSYKIDKYDNEIFLYYIHTNSLLSEISTIDSEVLNTYSNISFIEESQVLSIDYKLFKDKFLNNNILTNQLINEIIKRSSKLESLVNREFIFDAVSKVAMMLDSDLIMFNKLKRHDISLILHIQPATLSRVLNRLKRNSIITITQGKVAVIDKQNLEIIYKEWT